MIMKKNSFAEFMALLDLERLDENLFRGPSRDVGTNRVFGGQVLGQALKATQHTVESDRFIHSLHAYFLREGDHTAPIIYEVDRSRDGRSFSSRRVVAIQHGRPIFTLAASFQIEEGGLSFQQTMPDVPGPESLKSLQDHHAENLHGLPDKIRQLLLHSSHFDARPVTIEATPEAALGMQLYHHIWIKTADKLPENRELHTSILAYVSDYGLLGSTLIPHGIHFPDPQLQVASIDHAMWFHRSFRMDEWVLYSCEALSTSNARGLARGSFFKQDGTLIASTIQEGLIRIRK